MFVGSHRHTIDGKGRLILPSSFRSRLADGAVVAPLDSCLGILPVSEFERMTGKLEVAVSEGSMPIEAFRSWTGTAHHAVPDSQGRVRIPPHLRQVAGLGRNVMVTGAFKRVEVWDVDLWADVQTSGTEKLAEAIAHGRGIGNV